MKQELSKLTATEAVALLKRREVSPLELIDAAMTRIEATNPRLNSLVTLCLDRARKHAQRIMRQKHADVPAHYLYGLPIAIKDNLDVSGVRATSGSRIYADRIAQSSDIVVERLEANGAIVIGKTNMPEFAAGGNTFNDLFGATRNPWDTRMTSGGSSGGAAAALAAGQVWLANGGDFGGSIRQPASFCSVAGLRPSPGMVPKVQKNPGLRRGKQGRDGTTATARRSLLDPFAYLVTGRRTRAGAHHRSDRAAGGQGGTHHTADYGARRGADLAVGRLCRARAQPGAQRDQRNS